MSDSVIVTITLNPAIDQTAAIANFRAGAVNRVSWEQSDPGGKGVNVASFLTDLGWQVTVSGFLGQENSEIFQSLFERKQIINRFVSISGRTRTNVKIIDEVQNQVTDINFPGESPTPTDVDSFYRLVDELAIKHDWFILSGSLPQDVSPNIYAELTQRLKAQDKTVILDASGESLRLAIPTAPYAIKPNVEELQDVLGYALKNIEAIVQAGRQLVNQGLAHVIISMGEQGAVFVDAQSALWAKPPQVKVVSTVGAGDAMVAGFVAGKLQNLSLADSARLATACSLGALTQLGPRLPPIDQVKAGIDRVKIEEL